MFDTRSTQWRDFIFVTRADYEKQISYLFNPSTGHSIEVKGDDGEAYKRTFVSVVILEIWIRLVP